MRDCIEEYNKIKNIIEKSGRRNRRYFILIINRMVISWLCVF